MPVSLSEWRVRIGTFVHWIREYEVNQRRERLIKERIRRLKVLCERLEAKRGDSGEESEDDKNRQDGPDPKGCPHKTANIRSSGNSSDIKDLLTSCDQCIQDLLTASDSHIQEILTPSGCIIKELISPDDCSIKSPNMLNGQTIKNLITSNDSGIKELVTTNDFGIENLVKANVDSRIHDLVKANDDSRTQDLVKANDDSRIQDLLMTNYSSTCIMDPITPTYCSVKDVIVSKNAGTKPNDAPNASSTKVSTSLNASSIKDLITPIDSSIIDLITSEYSNVIDLITSNDTKIDSLLSLNETKIKRIIKPDDDYSEEQLAQAYNYVKTVRSSDDASMEHDTQVGEFGEQHMSYFSMSPRHSLSDASLRELLTSSDLSTKDLLNPTDDLNADLIINTSYIKEHETQSHGSVKELSSPGSGTTVCQPFAPYDDFLVELLKPTVSASKDLPSIDLCCHEPDSRNGPFSEENDKLHAPHFVGKEQHPQPDNFTKEPTGVELLKEHQIPSGNCKKSQTETSILLAVKRSPVVQIVSRKYCISERYGEKQVGESASSCHGPSFKSKTDLISGQIPPLSELLLLKSGDVELNPGPREAAGWSLDLERELLSLVKEVSPEHYYDLCNALGVSYAQGKVILTSNLLHVSNALSDVICSWRDKQRDGTNYKILLAEKLSSVDLDALGTRLVEGGYSTQDTPPQFTDERQCANELTQEEVIRCGEDFKTFYRTEMCKIKTDPLNFDSVKEFENIYTNLVLLRKEMGTENKTPLEYDDIFTMRINGEFPKRLLVEGEGGAGKTTYCSKIAWDWANGYKSYERFDWVIVIPMREIENCKTVGEIAKTYLSDGNMVQPRQIDDYILSKPSKVLIIFDGLDEYSGDILGDESDFGKIIRSEKFKECIILVTSRPWKANQIKSRQRLYKIYTFIGVEGFSSGNVSSYINKYFVDDNIAGADLIKFMEDNDVIQMNMAPFPIYVAMLCILWRESTKERREVIRKLKTFSQLFHQMIAFLIEHYISKSCNTHTDFLSIDTESIDKFLIEIGEIAFSGLLDKRLTFNENVFSSCKEAMDVCSKIGILSREKRIARRVERAGTKIQPVTFNVSFPHKLFQEYVAALYLASLFESKDVEYTTSIKEILEVYVYEFEYLIYFTASQGKGVGLDIINRLVKQKCEDDFLVDVAFEAYDTDSGEVVRQSIFREQKSLEIDDEMSAHTLSGYLFIMEQHAMETLIVTKRSCGPTVSRDLADVICSSTALKALELYGAKFHDDFYGILESKVNTSKIEKVCIDGLDLHGNDPTASRDLVKFLCLLPCLTDLTIQHIYFHDDFYHEIARLASSSKIEKVCIDGCDLHENDPSASRELAKFLCLLPCLTDLTIKDPGGQYRRPSLNDDFYHELARLASSSKIENVYIDGCDIYGNDPSTSRDLAKFLCLLPCLTDLTIKDHGDHCGPSSHNDGFYHELARLASSSKIEKVYIDGCDLYMNDPSASRDLAKFLCLLPCLTDLTIKDPDNKYDDDDFYDDLAIEDSDDQYGSPSHYAYFFHELARLASSSKIEKVYIDGCNLYDLSASRDLAKFLCLLPCLTDLTIKDPDNKYGRPSLDDDFYHELACLASSSKNPFCINNMTWATWYNENRPTNLPGRLLSEQPNQHGILQHQDINRLSESVLSLESSVTQQSIDSLSPGPVQDSSYQEVAQPSYSSYQQCAQLIPDMQSNRNILVQQPCLHQIKPSTPQGTQQIHGYMAGEQYTSQATLQSSHYISEPRAHTLSMPATMLQASPQMATQSQLTHLSCSQPFEQPNHPVHYFEGSNVQQYHFLPPQGPQDYPPLWQSQPLGDVPMASSSQMINQHRGMTPTTWHHRQSATPGTFPPPPNTDQYNLQNQTHVLRHLHLSQTPVLQDAWQHPDQNKVGEPFLPFQPSRLQHQPILSQNQERTQNLYQQPFSPQAPSQIATQSQLTNLSGSQQSEQSNQLARRWGEPQVYPYSQTPQHNLQRPQSMTEQPRYFSIAYSSYDAQRHIISPHQLITHPIQRHTLQSDTSTGASLPPSSQPWYHQTHVLHHPRQPCFSGNLPRSSRRDPQQPNTHHNTVERSRGPQPRHQQSP